MHTELHQDLTINQRIENLPDFERNRANLFDFVYYANCKVPRALETELTFLFRMYPPDYLPVRFFLDEPEQRLGLAKCAFSLYEDLVRLGQKELANDIRMDWNETCHSSESVPLAFMNI